MTHTTISLSEEMVTKIHGFLTGSKTISRFVYEATEEKIKRMEVRDKNARLQLHKKDMVLLEPIITDILKRHKLI